MQRALFIAAFAATLTAAPAIFPLKDVRAGQTATGRTVFNGTRVEDFQVEILGVLENIGPGQSIILARLKGGPLADTGVMQGMSGSPVYIDGKLAGAVALGFTGAKDAIAGIRPIEEMLTVNPESSATQRQIASVPKRSFMMAGNTRLEEIATPVSFSGFSAAALERFAPQLRELGLDPRQGASSGGRIPDRMGDIKSIEPGSMISVQLLSGDMSVSAEGTVTAIDGNHIYAFGHRFLDSGPTELPFAKAEVLALLPNIQNSFKISQAREWMGSITQDRNTAISGLAGRRAAMTPIEIKSGGKTYRMDMIQDRVMTPLVAQMAIFSVMDASERSVGPITYRLSGRMDFDSGPVEIDNVYSGDVAVGALASLGVATPLTYALSSGLDGLGLKGASFTIQPVEKHSQMQIAEVVGPRQVRPGDEIELSVTLAADNGAETVKKVRYRVPVGAAAGPLNFTVSDSTVTNLTELQGAMTVPAHSASQVLGLLNSTRANTSAYVRVWRGEPSYTVDGRDLPDTPPSVAMILGRPQQGSGSAASLKGSKLAELEIPLTGSVVTGSKTMQVEVKE
jgi:SpoIVB peptidase S55